MPETAHPVGDPAIVAAALRFGWLLAEVRGRYWPDGPRPVSTPLPAVPDGVLPLRSQRSGDDSRREAVESLVALAGRIELSQAEELTTGLFAAIAPWDEQTSAPGRHSQDWTNLAALVQDWDARVQNELARRDEQLANAYLLGRGLAECYWGLGPDASWTADGQVTGVALPFLLGEDRRTELTRMLGRFGPHLTHDLAGPAIAGSLEAWGAVSEDADWSRQPELRTKLYEQVRRWYQLLVLDQDPTTMLRPGARLAGTRDLARSLRTFGPAVLVILVVTGLWVVAGRQLGDKAGSLVVGWLAAGSGVSVAVLAPVAARARGMAQQLATRYRQDAYTDLVAVCVTVVPSYPAGDRAAALRQTGRSVEAAVRSRLLTPPTPALATAGRALTRG